MYVYYETSSQKIIINATGLLGKKSKLIVYDLTGRVISIVDLNTISNEFRYEIPLEGLATGLYLISLETLSEKLVKRIVKN
jgi:myo-inositol-hexaphosphate 3-phosphohydrolase